MMLHTAVYRCDNISALALMRILHLQMRRKNQQQQQANVLTESMADDIQPKTITLRNNRSITHLRYA